MVWLGDMPYAEIADTVDSSETADRKSFSRSPRKIGNFLSGECRLFIPKGSCRCKIREPIRRVVWRHSRFLGEIPAGLTLLLA